MTGPDRIWINEKWEAYLRPTSDGDTSGYIRLAAIQPDPEARQADLAKAFCMGRDMAAETADDCRRLALAGMGMGPVLDAIRALIPPADLAAKIGGE